MTNHELKTQILRELCGWEISSTENTIRATGTLHRLVGIAPGTNYLQALPDITGSVDACLEHIVPAMRKRGYLPEWSENQGAIWCVEWYSITRNYEGTMSLGAYTGGGETLPLAICYATVQYLDTLKRT